jgi:hypothetical protein
MDEVVMEHRVNVRMDQEMYDWLVSRGNPSKVMRDLVTKQMVTKQDNSDDLVTKTDNDLVTKDLVTKQMVTKRNKKLVTKPVVSDDEVVECLKDSILEHQEQCGGILPAFGMSMYEFMQCPAAARSQWGLTGGFKANGPFKVWYEKSSWKYLHPKDAVVHPKDVYIKEVV